jgi:hypothetical protein
MKRVLTGEAMLSDIRTGAAAAEGVAAGARKMLVHARTDRSRIALTIIEARFSRAKRDMRSALESLELLK